MSQDVTATGIKVLPSRKTDGQGQGGWDSQKPAAPSGDAWTGGDNTGGWGGAPAGNPPF